MVGEFVGGALGRDAAALVEGLVEDAYAVERAAVVAGGDAGALCSSVCRPVPRWGDLTFRFDFLQARQAVETRFFHRLEAVFAESRGGLPSDEGDGPGASWRYCDASLMSPWEEAPARGGRVAELGGY